MGRNKKKSKQEGGSSNNDDNDANTISMEINSTAGNDDISLIIVLPGDNVTEKIRSIEEQNKPNAAAAATTKSKPKPRKLGIGLRYDNTAEQNIYVTCAGRLEWNSRNNTFFVKQNTKRYQQSISQEDRVIGIVEDRMGMDGMGGELYRINIGGPHAAILSNLSFEGATKRNKPQLFPGMLLYCRVSSLMHNNQNRFPNVRGYGTMDPVLSCQLGPNDVGLARKDWMTNEGTYGELKGGTCCKISLGLARELLHPQNCVLRELAKYSGEAKRDGCQITGGFEICVGVNGYLWVHSNQPAYTIMIQNAILNSQVMTEEQTSAMVKSLMYTVEKQLQQEYDRD